MSFPATPLWRLIKGYLVVTERVPDGSYWTRVFPAQDDAHEHISRFGVTFDGVNFDNLCEKYSRCYATVAEAREGHDAILLDVETQKRRQWMEHGRPD